MSDSCQKLPWFAIQARTCAEKTACAVLQNKGYECYLPLAKSRRRWSDRIKHLEMPLFPGYLFCRFDPYNRLPVLQTPGVLQIVGIGKTLIPVDEHEIAAIQCAGMSGLPVQPWPFLEVGNLVRIEQGPLRGLTGIIVNCKSELKVILSVTLLRRSVAVEVDSSCLTGLHSASSPPAVLKLSPPIGSDLNHPAALNRDSRSTPPAGD
jgi:transcription antitermination factor NusG